MLLERYPNAKYARAIYRMRTELMDWRNRYREAALSTEPDHLKGRFAARAVQLDSVIEALTHVTDELNRMPRLS